MSDFAKQISGLSAEKRQLLEQYLKTAGLNLSNSVILPRTRDTNVFPLSFAQQRLWFLDQLEPNTSVYNIPDTHYFDGPINLEALERSLSEIMRRHEVLRTTFQSRNGEPLQVIAEPQPQKLEVVDLSHLPEAEREAEAQRMADEEAERPFDLARGPLFRFRLLRLAETNHILLLNMHTSFRMVGQLRYSGVNWALCTKPLTRVRRRHCLTCRFSTRTLRCGSVSGCKERHSKSNSPTGANS